ncbi:MAG: FixH family protein [Deinococcota bacterium]
MRFFVLVMLLLLVSCRPPDNADVVRGSDARANQTSLPEDLRVLTEVIGDPQVGEQQVRVYILQENQAVEDATVQITGDMTHAGMEPVFADAPQTEPGLYETQDFAFTMSGDWFITADITLSDGRTASDVLSLTVPGR